jgi:cytochrome P450
MNDEQIRDEVVTLILAGHETTANALAWTWHLLSRHPAVESRLHAEIEAIIGDAPPSVDDVARLPFTRAVFAEAMRLFPPAYLLGRRALQAFDVPGTPFVVPRGTVVFVSQYLLHRDERFWREAAQFDPERWMNGATPAAHRYAYFPFGAGPRICIGEQFAWTEGVLVLATLARSWRFSAPPNREVGLEPIVTLRPRHGLPMTAVARAA